MNEKEGGRDGRQNIEDREKKSNVTFAQALVNVHPRRCFHVFFTPLLTSTSAAFWCILRESTSSLLFFTQKKKNKQENPLAW